MNINLYKHRTISIVGVGSDYRTVCPETEKTAVNKPGHEIFNGRVCVPAAHALSTSGSGRFTNPGNVYPDDPVPTFQAGFGREDVTATEGFRGKSAVKGLGALRAVRIPHLHSEDTPSIAYRYPFLATLEGSER